MSPVSNPSVVRQIASLFDGGSVAGLTDRQLLERFTARRDAVGEAAFAALVSRHGPMVLDLCWQILGDRHDAEDAFQAVFLVLARKARSIRDPEMLGNWLYGVALRTARKAKGQNARRRMKEEGDAMRRPGSRPGIEIELAEHPVLALEQAEVLYSEIERLPGRFRLPVVLCYFDGLTIDETAHRLRCPAGTVRSRLARAYEKLRRGLSRRGVVLPVAAISLALTARETSASVSSSLCYITTRAAIGFAARQATAGASSATAIALAHEVLRSMLVTKLKLVAWAFLLVGAVAGGAGLVAQVLGHQAGKSDLQEHQAGKPDLRPIAARTDDASAKPGPGRMFVVGRVLDPQGKPVPNAKVMVHARVKQSGGAPGTEGLYPALIGDAEADGSGRFRLDAPRTASSRDDEFMAVALAPGYGVG
jgi:RNA polymerase sigma factor (sigma-70 family)